MSRKIWPSSADATRFYKYGIRPEAHREMLATQDGLCAICRKLPDGQSLVVDHDHKTRAVRGLLCRSCNTGIGHFVDSSELLESAAAYLRSRTHQKPDEPIGVSTPVLEPQKPATGSSALIRATVESPPPLEFVFGREYDGSLVLLVNRPEPVPTPPPLEDWELFSGLAYEPDRIESTLRRSWKRQQAGL